MNIDVRTNEVVYITINDEVIYVDYSTEKLIIDTWKVDGEEVSDFLDDEEKMADFKVQTKEDFLRSYSYLTEQEYDNTNARIQTRGKS